MKQLYPFQAELAKTIAAHDFILNRSDVGTGKTAMAIGTFQLLQVHRILIVCPKSVAPQWENEIKEFWPEAKVSRPVKPPRLVVYERFVHTIQDTVPTILICTYEQIRSDYPLFTNIVFDVVYADEVHRIKSAYVAWKSGGKIKSTGSITHKALSSLRADRRYGATATPMRSSPLDLYGIFEWLSPGLLGSYWQFMSRYVVKNALGFIISFKNLDELNLRIAPYCVGITLEQAGHQMPSLIEEDIIFPLSRTEQLLYNKIKNEIILQIKQEEISKVKHQSTLYNAVVKLGKLQELTDSLELLGDNRNSSKLEILKEHLADSL